MSVIEIAYDEAVAFNEAVADMHEACDYARRIRDACEFGLELSDEEGQELVEMVREKVETCERWLTALQFQPIPLPVPPEPKPAQRKPAAIFARVGPCGIVSHGAGPNANFGSTVLRRGDWYGR